MAGIPATMTVDPRLSALKRAYGLDDLRVDADTWITQDEPDATAPETSWSAFGGRQQRRDREFFAPVFRWRKGDKSFAGKPRVHLKPHRYGHALAYVETSQEDEMAMLRDLDAMIRESLASKDPATGSNSAAVLR